MKKEILPCLCTNAKPERTWNMMFLSSFSVNILFSLMSENFTQKRDRGEKKKKKTEAEDKRGNSISPTRCVRLNGFLFDCSSWENGISWECYHWRCIIFFEEIISWNDKFDFKRSLYYENRLQLAELKMSFTLQKEHLLKLS